MDQLEKMAEFVNGWLRDAGRPDLKVRIEAFEPGRMGYVKKVLLLERNGKPDRILADSGLEENLSEAAAGLAERCRDRLGGGSDTELAFKCTVLGKDAVLKTLQGRR